MENSNINLMDYSYTIETFSIFKNVDKSILNLNPTLEKFGYQFVNFGLLELEKDFSSLFSLPKDFKSEMLTTLQDLNITISYEFYKAYSGSRIFGDSMYIFDDHIFLKRISNFTQVIKNNSITQNESIKVLGEISKFTTSLIQQLRLFKNGDIDSEIQFQISKSKRAIGMQFKGNLGRTYELTKYTLSEEEAKALIKKIEFEFKSNQLTEIAISNFNLSYNISDIKTRYITLMTCLESLFNQGRDQITHTVSRHLALLISNNAEEFKKNYYRTKELYRLRSTIVHGDSTKDDLYKSTYELQEKVRKAIVLCLDIPINKKQLFDKLNTFGFGKLEF